MIDTKRSRLVSEETGYTLLLSHRPELFEIYVSDDVDLVLSDHAHGGQFGLPFVVLEQAEENVELQIIGGLFYG